METLGRVWNRLSIRRPTIATPEPVEEEDDMTPEKTREVFQMFNGTPTRRKSESAHHHRAILNQMENHQPRNSTQSPKRQPRISESSMDIPGSSLRRNSTETHVFANRAHLHSDIVRFLYACNVDMSVLFCFVLLCSPLSLVSFVSHSKIII
ncbi:hypothetical protein B9Z55_023950 [Caenorhabditis nigoni]|uniref:Uncharacterized protein n=1 Tax=Caenorhabditis nigoni TaxID=1611254 RepID=A0A2G5SSQ7_9PELO|nr:hypothetical protein B9Z55_023950 [Caenorhabditis nigoni]